MLRRKFGIKSDQIKRG